MTLYPLNVSFVGIQWREGDCPPENVIGDLVPIKNTLQHYAAREDGSTSPHVDFLWLNIGEDNKPIIGSDQAFDRAFYWYLTAVPFTAPSGFDWNIPIYVRDFDTQQGERTVNWKVLQSTTCTPPGTISITKAGATTSRIAFP